MDSPLLTTLKLEKFVSAKTEKCQVTLGKMNIVMQVSVGKDTQLRVYGKKKTINNIIFDVENSKCLSRNLLCECWWRQVILEAQ